jgi:hypothetical protein
MKPVPIVTTLQQTNATARTELAPVSLDRHYSGRFEDDVGYVGERGDVAEVVVDEAEVFFVAEEFRVSYTCE